MDSLLALQLFLLSFIVAVFAVYGWSKANKKIIGIDINKLDQRKIAEGTGIVLLLPLWICIAAIGFAFGFDFRIFAFGLLASIFSIIGFIDDTRLKWKSKQLKWLSRAFPIALVSLAFAAIFSQNIFWIIPLALFIAGLASFQNTFAGLNGWQGGSGFIIAVAAAFVLSGLQQLLVIALAGAVLGFLVWNKCPARVLEGDSGTLLIGSGIAAAAVIEGNVLALIIVFCFFVPHIFDILLKFFTNPRDMSQSRQRPYKLLEDGRLGVPEAIEGRQRLDFAKLLFKIFGPMREWQAVAAIWAIVFAWCLVVLALFGKLF